MFVQNTTPSAGLAEPPDPGQDRATSGGAAPGATTQLLGLVRRLIDFGVALVTTLQQGASAYTVVDVMHNFGIPDLAAIVARITRGLQLAAALEARLISGVAPGQLGIPAIRLASPRNPPDGEPGRPRGESEAAAPDYMPTAEEIAASVQNRPVGAVIADIVRDLGILPSHPMWPELSDAISFNGGNLAALVAGMLVRGSIGCGNPDFPEYPWPAEQPGKLPAPAEGGLPSPEALDAPPGGRCASVDGLASASSGRTAPCLPSPAPSGAGPP